MIKSRVVFKYKVLNTEYYDEALNAYKVICPENVQNYVIAKNDLIIPHSLHVFKSNGDKFVLLLNSNFTEFYG